MIFVRLLQAVHQFKIDALGNLLLVLKENLLNVLHLVRLFNFLLFLVRRANLCEKKTHFLTSDSFFKITQAPLL